MIDFNHHSLSTYGIGKEHSKATWQNLSRKFIRKGLLVQDMDEYGALKLTTKAYNVMKGEMAVTGVLNEPGKSLRVAARNEEHDPQLFEKLRVLRKELAASDNVPPYVIFSDKTLIEMAALLPRTREDLLKIHGIGTHKLEKFGDAVLTVVNTYCAEYGISSRPPVKEPERTEQLKKPRHLVIAEMYNEGLSVADISRNESIKLNTIISYLYQYILDGNTIRKEGIIPLLPDDEKLVAEISGSFSRLGTEYLKPVFTDLGGGVDYEILGILRLYCLATGD